MGDETETEPYHLCPMSQGLYFDVYNTATVNYTNVITNFTNVKGT
jgi:hypothetical protein